MGPGGEYPKQIGAKISVKRLRARDSYACTAIAIEANAPSSGQRHSRPL